MNIYKVNKRTRWLYVPAFDVETYVNAGFDLYIEEYIEIEDVDREYSRLEFLIDIDALGKYWAQKDGVLLRIQPFRIKDFYSRGYKILQKKIKKIDDVKQEIDKINSSDDILKIETS